MFFSSNMSQSSCTVCGTSNPPGSLFCSACGTRLAGQVQSPTPTWYGSQSAATYPQSVQYPPPPPPAVTGEEVIGVMPYVAFGGAWSIFSLVFTNYAVVAVSPKQLSELALNDPNSKAAARLGDVVLAGAALFGSALAPLGNAITGIAGLANWRRFKGKALESGTPVAIMVNIPYTITKGSRHEYAVIREVRVKKDRLTGDYNIAIKKPGRFHSVTGYWFDPRGIEEVRALLNSTPLAPRIVWS
jgi:hypothetical protein